MAKARNLPAKDLPPSASIRLHYREHEFGPSMPQMRVWAEGWAGDQFEVLDYSDFTAFQGMMERFGIPLIHHTSDED